MQGRVCMFPDSIAQKGRENKIFIVPWTAGNTALQFLTVPQLR